MSRAGVISFPGSNGDDDALVALRDNLGLPARMIDYREGTLDEFDFVVVPGGFSYGDHLRCGAIARFSPIMEPLRQFVERGAPVLGICNGFQILTEAHLLPGSLLRNENLEFHCDWVHIRAESTQTVWTGDLMAGDVLKLPVAHGEGAYFADDATLDRMEQNGQVVFRYCDESGEIRAGSNFNGSVRGIAGISNQRGNVVGLMPHPERACDPLLGRPDGLKIFQSALAALRVAV